MTFKPPASPKEQSGANQPQKPAAKPKAPKRPDGGEGVTPGDQVYIKHPKLGALSVAVKGVGRDGFIGRCDQGKRHRVTWDRYLGHRARMLHRYTLVEQGADGALVEDAKGRRRYMAGEVPQPEPPAPPPAPPSDDPILGGLDRLTKALPMPMPLPPRQHRFPAGTLLLLKGGSIANRPGLSLQRVTDKAGNQTQRWEKNTPDQPGQGKPAAPASMKHGDTIRFRHGDVEGRGRITASGADGVTVQSEDGNTHQIRHEHVQGREPTRPKYPDRMAGEEDKPYLKRIKGELPDPDHLPEEHDRYFNMGPKTQTVPMDQLVSTKSAEENEKGGNNSPKFMAAAYHGAVSKRDPISVRKREDGKYEVTDGNGTLTGVQKHGWKELPVNVEDGEGQSGKGGAGGGGELGPDVQPLFQADQTTNLPKSCGQPTSDKEELFAKSGEALESLKDWLNKGKGLCSQMGHQTMSVSPEKADFSQPGGMLFIAPLKGQDRAAQKVAQDYGGDWSKLIDTVRCTIAVDSHEELPGVVEKLMSGGMKMARQPKDRFAKPIPCGYRDALLNITLPNGLVGEVQLHVKPMLQAKNDGHHHYEIERDIEPKIKKGTATSEDMATLKQAQDDMKSLYVAAWQKAAGGAGDDAPAPMRKALPAGKTKGRMPMGKNAEQGGQFTYFDHDNAQYRRKENGITRGVDDVLVNGEWKPYGGDALAPGLYGDEIPDPLGGGRGGGGEPMTKSLFILRKG